MQRKTGISPRCAGLGVGFLCMCQPQMAMLIVRLETGARQPPSLPGAGEREQSGWNVEERKGRPLTVHWKGPDASCEENVPHRE